MESKFGRFWRYEMASVQLIPLDHEQPRLGGKVSATGYVLDIRTMSPSIRSYAGVYGEDFITFGEFAPGNKHALDDDELLLKICEDNVDPEAVLDRHNFRFDGDKLVYSRDVAGHDEETEHAVGESELTPTIGQTWSETFFYGLGNKNM